MSLFLSLCAGIFFLSFPLPLPLSQSASLFDLSSLPHLLLRRPWLMTRCLTVQFKPKIDYSTVVLERFGDLYIYQYFLSVALWILLMNLRRQKLYELQRGEVIHEGYCWFVAVLNFG